MTLKDTKEICIQFFYHWFNSNGSNTEQGFEDWIKMLENDILAKLEKLDEGYGIYKRYLAQDTGINTALLTLLLKKLKLEGRVKIMRLFNENTGLVAGCGYCLAQKNPNI